MSFKIVVCWFCKYPNEFYGRWVPLCPKCGAGCNGSLPIVSTKRVCGTSTRVGVA